MRSFYTQKTLFPQWQFEFLNKLVSDCIVNLIQLKGGTNKWSFKSYIALLYHGKWKKVLTNREEKFLQGGWEFFPSGKKQLFALQLSKRNQFKHLIISSRQHLTRLQCMFFPYVAMGEIFIVSTVYSTKYFPKQRLNHE